MSHFLGGAGGFGGGGVAGAFSQVAGLVAGLTKPGSQTQCSFWSGLAMKQTPLPWQGPTGWSDPQA